MYACLYLLMYSYICVNVIILTTDVALNIIRYCLLMKYSCGNLTHCCLLVLSGGAGYVMSNEALKRIGQRPHGKCQLDLGSEDIKVRKTFLHLLYTFSCHRLHLTLITIRHI